jgi:hypothetical protein
MTHILSRQVKPRKGGSPTDIGSKPFIGIQRVELPPGKA